MSTCIRAPSLALPAERTMYKRPLPADLERLDSKAGRELFAQALRAGTMEGYFKLAQQFHTQADPAFCGLGSLVCGLNALEIDPLRRWKGSWRWFSEELLDCCRSLEDIRRYGLTLDQVACLATCSAAKVAVFRPPEADVELFREHAYEAATRSDAPVVIANYSRRTVGQTGDGHFSPIGGYHAATDRVLVLDTARFKYPPHWMPLQMLFGAMRDADAETGLSRGWLLLDRLDGE